MENNDIDLLENDPWIIFQGEMAEDFFKFHRSTMPENPHDVWDQNEVIKFCYAFTLFAAEMKFRRTYLDFPIRENQYKSFLKFHLDEDGEETLYDILNGYENYIILFKNGFSSIFSAITKGVYKPACKSFVNKSCKRYIFSEKDMIKIVSNFVTDKNIEFDKSVPFK